MKNRLILFLLAFLAWSLLAGVRRYPPPGWDWPALLAGAAAAALTAALFGAEFPGRSVKLLQPARWFWALIFVPVFAWSCFQASLQVVYLVLHPGIPVKPGIVKIRSRLRGRTALALLANCITLTPGTMTVEATGTGELYVHWITVKTVDEEAAGRIIAGRFERYLKKIFE